MVNTPRHIFKLTLKKPSKKPTKKPSKKPKIPRITAAEKALVQEFARHIVAQSLLNAASRSKIKPARYSTGGKGLFSRPSR